jgi:uncharacterized protein DUF4326
MTIVHCQREPYDTYIGRGRDPRSGEIGRWGNPFSHRPSKVPGVTVVASREEAIRCYAKWLREEVLSERIALADLAQLHGKVLGCWCAPQPCHGEVLERAAAWANERLAIGDGVFWELRPGRRGGCFE